MGEAESRDRIILALKQKYREKQSEGRPAGREILVGTDVATLHRELLFGGKCSMLLPETLKDMGDRERAIKYRNRNRPQIIKTDHEGDVSMTFGMIPIPEGGETEDVREKLGRIRDGMRKVWKQNVFYDTGEVEADGTTVAWMDFKAFCLDGSLYSLLFLFRAGGEEVLGNFHCSFPRYDIWKPAVLKLLATIKTEGQES